MLLAHFFKRIITVGRLRVVDAGGRSHTFEGSSGARVAIRLHDPALHWKLLVRPRLYLPEAYVDGALTIEDGSLYDLIDLLAANIEVLPEGLLGSLLNGYIAPLRRLYQYNPVSRARQNVAHHYDLSDPLYELFLDRDRQYSCAYFYDSSDDLDTAQLNKKRHIAAKLLIRPGQRVLDIGAGWGGLALYLAGECGADVTGLTLSAEQHKAAVLRAAAAGLSDRVRFHLRDYREEVGHYDRIVSVGMFEHVGINHYNAFFTKLKSLLAPDGVALLHSIGRMDGPWLDPPVDPQIYLPRRLLSGALRSGPGGRTDETMGHRRRDPPSALRRDAKIMAASLRTESRAASLDLRRAFLPHVGDVPGRVGDRLPAGRVHGLPDATRESDRFGADDARLHAGLGTRTACRSRPGRLTSSPPSTRCEFYSPSGRRWTGAILWRHGNDHGFSRYVAART